MILAPLPRHEPRGKPRRVDQRMFLAVACRRSSRRSRSANQVDGHRGLPRAGPRRRSPQRDLLPERAPRRRSPAAGARSSALRAASTVSVSGSSIASSGACSGSSVLTLIGDGSRDRQRAHPRPQLRVDLRRHARDRAQFAGIGHQRARGAIAGSRGRDRRRPRAPAGLLVLVGVDPVGGARRDLSRRPARARRAAASAARTATARRGVAGVDARRDARRPGR